jgi:hypothetical protein
MKHMRREPRFIVVVDETNPPHSKGTDLGPYCVVAFYKHDVVLSYLSHAVDSYFLPYRSLVAQTTILFSITLVNNLLLSQTYRINILTSENFIRDVIQ